MSIGTSVSIKSYGQKDSFWVIETIWGRESKSFHTKDENLAKQVAKDWSSIN